jgi:ferric-dicitrate binding protein FerR (iron transport regulator)
MNELYKDIDALLAKMLSQEASAEEINAVEKWQAASPENQQYFKEFQWIWEKSQAANAIQKVDTEAALQKVHQRIDAAPSLRVVKKPVKFLNLSFLMKIAAAVMIGIFFYNQFSKPDLPVSMVTASKPQTDTLTDGSIITLNKKSALTLSEKFNKNERRMALTGEAYFEVAHDVERPFVVEIQNLEVQAVGTAFNIDNNSNLRFVSIMVTDGKVKISHKTDVHFVVKGQTAIYDTETATLSIETAEDKNKLAYKTNQFHFNETPLRVALNQLSKGYDTAFIVNNKELENCLLTVTFDNKSLDEILDVIALTFSCTIEKKTEGIILNGGKCQ